MQACHEDELNLANLFCVGCTILIPQGCLTNFVGHLSKRDLAAVLNYLTEIKHKWIDIGIQLELDPEELEKKTKDNSSAGDSMRTMLLDWLKGDDPLPTWKALSSALRMPAVNETTIAGVIESERVFVAVSSGKSPNQS